MKGKYVNIQIHLACLTKPVMAKSNIHADIRKSIIESREIREQLVQTGNRFYLRDKRQVMATV